MATLVIFGELGTTEVRWKIQDFKNKLNFVENNFFHEFSFMDVSNKFTLKMYKFADNNEPMDFIQINNVKQWNKPMDFISIQINNVKQADYDSVLRVENRSGIQREFDIGTKKSGNYCKELGFPRWIKKPKLMEFLDDNTLSVVWTPRNILTPPKPLAKPVAVDTVFDDLEKAFSNKQFSDIQLLCKEEKFDCHRVILAARSPVFAAMFNHDMKENINKEVKLDSMEPKILKEMLSYIYCGKVKALIESADAMELLKVADQYQLDGLKETCGSFLSSNLKADNVLDLLTLSESCNEKLLKKNAMAWLVKNQNIKTLMKTKRWEELEEKFPRLLVDVMKVVIDHRIK